MNLDETQVAKVRQWVDQGLKAADIQTRLMDELGLKLTYAELRFLLGDLQLRPKDPPPAPKAPDSVLTSPSAPPAPGPGSQAPKTPAPGDVAGTGKVAVTVDELARPTMAVSGKVTFSDGQKAEWGIDQTGRPVLIPAKQGYRPSQSDVMEFQTQLEQVLNRFGY